jgi:hypothetical protein
MADVTSEEVTKEWIENCLIEYVIEPYADQFDTELTEKPPVQIKPNEFLAAMDKLIKLKGYDKIESGEELPDTLILKLP